MDRTFKTNSVFLLFFFAIFFSDCNSNTDIKTKNTDSRKQENNADSLALIETSATADTVLFPESYKSSDYEAIGFELMETDALGEIKIGLAAEKIKDLLLNPDKKSNLIMWGSDGEYHQTWYYYQQGLELDIKGKDSTDQVVFMATLKAPGTLQTKRHIGIGSDINEVKQAYKKAIDPQVSSTNTLIAGSYYGGIIFSLENQKVKQIFFGASGE